MVEYRHHGLVPLIFVCRVLELECAVKVHDAFVIEEGADSSPVFTSP